MINISHRGNINGRNVKKENSPEYILSALEQGYECEIDVWFIKDQWFLGHDNPTYKIDEDFLKDKRLWCHAKSIGSLVEMLKESDIHCFWHQEDDVTLTSQQYIWTYPDKLIWGGNAIAVLPELYNSDIERCVGICSDYIGRYGLPE